MQQLIILAIPAFIAGFLTFFAPCTLPLVPGYISFISGVSFDDINNIDSLRKLRAKVFFNGLSFVFGFSLIFMFFGLAAGFGGSLFLTHRILIARLGGFFVILFGLFMLDIVKLKFLRRDYRLPTPKIFKPNSTLNAAVLGAVFAFGWTPCIGPVLGSILFLASTSSTAGSGALLLLIFSAGLAIPFLLVAAGIGSAMRLIGKYQKILKTINIIGGLFLILVGLLMLSDKMIWLTSYGYQFFSFIEYHRLLDFL